MHMTTTQQNTMSTVAVGSMVMVQVDDRTFYAEVESVDGDRVIAYPVRTVSQLAAPVEFLVSQIVRSPR